MPPINGADGVPPIHRAHSMPPIHIHGFRHTCLAISPLLAMATVCSWYAANGMPPINGAHGVPPIHRAHSMPPIHIHGFRHTCLAISPLLAMATVGHPLSATNGVPPIHGAHGVPPIHGAHGVPPIHGAHGMPPIHIHGSRPTCLHCLHHIPLILVPTTQYIPLLAMATVCSWYAANGMPPINGAHGVPPIHRAHSMLPIHIHGFRHTCPAISPLLAMATVGHPLSAANGMPPIHRAHGMPQMVCRPSIVPMVCRKWYAAHPSCPWYAAHPYSWLSAHPSTLSTSYTTYPSTYYTIYTTIGYGHCRPTRMHWHHIIV
jgi:hypothetical protein